jgi:hypothetical protein
VASRFARVCSAVWVVEVDVAVEVELGAAAAVVVEAGLRVAAPVAVLVLIVELGGVAELGALPLVEVPIA